ncbi:Putative ABC transporter substrate binding protein (modular protein) [Candidatus Promineifilum breve]|uniref:ABC transporter substrate binding protein (Modular protein) n=1 Tax=Candidatus Promineifilum breve TaxID=1806508 RepID=A0A170PHP7_9CHLR|nr:extracellular solute-binding protein [Candidatus Promineifilum breve]CUS04423.2 Putative ABC transporter substrate binding protein (modular protein) [Candidatus Promineifilum breve]
MKNTKWYLLVVVLLLGAFVLAACGGGTTETTEQPVATEEAPAVEEATEAPEVVEEPTEVPTEAPAEVATEAPTEEPAVEETMLASDTTMTMVELLSADPNFSTLVAAFTASELTEPAADAPGTLFAPTNAAFEALDPAQLEAFMADPTGDLARILQYHMVSGAVMAADATADEDGMLDTAAGEPLDLAALNLTQTDIETSNGVIHVIDAVQVPPTILNAAIAEEVIAGGGSVIRIWADNLRMPALRQVETTFEDEYDVELLLEQVGFGDIRRLLSTAGPAGEGPDIIIGAHDWLGELYAGGLITPVDLGDRASEFAPAAIQAFTFAGDLYGMPVNTENVALFINTDLVPECPTTWTEVHDISAELHAADANQYGFVRMEGDPYHFYPIQTAFGGYIFARDDAGSYDPTQVGVGDPGSIAAATWYEGMVAEGLQPPAMDWDTMHQWFESGQAAMLVTGPWVTDRIIASEVPFQICNIPGETEEAGRPFLGAHGFMISAFANDPLLAQIFLTEFVATPEVMMAMYEGNPRPPAFLETLNAVEDQYITAFGQAGANADPMPAIAEMASVWDAWGNAVVLISQGADTAENAFTNAQQQIITAISGG